MLARIHSGRLFNYKNKAVLLVASTWIKLEGITRNARSQKEKQSTVPPHLHVEPQLSSHPTLQSSQLGP